MGSGDDSSYFNTNMNNHVQPFKHHTDTVQIVKFSKDGKLFATGAMDDTLCIYDSQTLQLKHQINGCNEEIRSIDWHFKGRVVLTGGADGSIWIHNANNAQFMATFQGHQKPITSAVFSKDGKKIVSASEDGVVRVWDPLSSKCIHKIQGYNFHQQSIDCLAQHHSQPIVVTGGMDYFGCLSNIATGKVLG